MWWLFLNDIYLTFIKGVGCKCFETFKVSQLFRTEEFMRSVEQKNPRSSAVSKNAQASTMPNSYHSQSPCNLPLHILMIDMKINWNSNCIRMILHTVLLLHMIGWLDNCMHEEVQLFLIKGSVHVFYAVTTAYLLILISRAIPVLEFSGTCSILRTVSKNVTLTLLKTKEKKVDILNDPAAGNLKKSCTTTTTTTTCHLVNYLHKLPLKQAGL